MVHAWLDAPGAGPPAEPPLAALLEQITGFDADVLTSRWIMSAVSVARRM